MKNAATKTILVDGQITEQERANAERLARAARVKHVYVGDDSIGCQLRSVRVVRTDRMLGWA